MEDLGDERVVSGDPPAPIEARYEAAVDLLAALHRRKLPHALAVAPHLEHRLPRYDLGAFLIEAELLLDWYLADATPALTSSARADFIALWRDALDPALKAFPTWVLRDYHSPNLLWLPQRQGLAQIGLLDFQDALIGPAAYDVASLLQDARVDVPEDLEMKLLSRYARARMGDQNFDAAEFAMLYATLAAQRATEDSGHLRAARPARRQATISPSCSAAIALSGKIAGSSGAGAVEGLVRNQRAAAEWAMIRGIGG